MAKIISEERVLDYSKEFKVKIVELTHKFDVNAADIAEVMGLHPVMVYRWSQEYKQGTLVADVTRKVSMTLDKKRPPPLTKRQLSENERLKKENTRLKKENDLLKKWRQYLAEVRQNDSGL